MPDSLSGYSLSFPLTTVAAIAELLLHRKPTRPLAEPLTLTAPDARVLTSTYTAQGPVGLLLWSSTAKGMKFTGTGFESLLFHLLHLPEPWFAHW